MAMPRSPAPQLPAGRLCSTWVSPCWCNCSRNSALSKSYGNRYSTPPKPAALAAAKRSTNGISANSIVRLAANLGTVRFLVLGRQQRARRIRLRRCIVQRQIEHFLELDDVVDLGSHRNVGDALENELDHDRHLVLGHPFPRGRERRLRVVWIGDADRLAAKALGDRDVIDAVDAEFRRVDVLERELDLIVHLKTALRLPDQSEIGVVYDDMDVGQLELRADRQLLDQELEIIIARQ